MPTLAVVNFNIVCATLGGFVTLFGLVSYLCKEKFYLSEAREFTDECQQFSILKFNSHIGRSWSDLFASRDKFSKT